MEPQKQKTYSLEELRKTHPKAYARWAEDEDKRLMEDYEQHKQSGSADFEAFLQALSNQFGRKPNGIRGRLAKFFPDIEGWDYEFQKKRDEAKKKEKAEKVEALVEEKAVEIPKLDLSGNPQAQEALRLMEESNENVFLTGEAGTGKSTLLQYFRKTTKKNVAVLAPTGVAALNVEGQTIHSFCSFGSDVTLQKVKKLNPFSPKVKLLKNLDTVFIDEISMVRADLLDYVDKFLRMNGPTPSLPFGGLQMVFIGDLYQLPPVDKDFGAGDGLIKEYQSPYFFDSHVFALAKFKFIELKTIYRQKDQVFKDVLNAVRNNAASQEHLNLLNSRAKAQGDKFTPHQFSDPNFISQQSNAQQIQTGEKSTVDKTGAGFTFEKFAIYLTPTNTRARQINNFFLEDLSTEVKSYQGIARGNFKDRELPTDLDLQIKLGAQVMMLNNDSKKRWVNGTMGKILGIELAKKEVAEDGIEISVPDSISIELETGEIVSVFPHTWEMFQFILQKGTLRVDSKTTGTFTQYPFKLAWAVTIHKAQGKTFDKVYIDLSTGTFAHGQLYVALSRCRTLEGLHLKRDVEQKDIILDDRIVKFLESFVSQEKMSA